MSSSHSPGGLVVSFDDDHAVANAGRLLPTHRGQGDRRDLTVGFADLVATAGAQVLIGEEVLFLTGIALVLSATGVTRIGPASRGMAARQISSPVLASRQLTIPPSSSMKAPPQSFSIAPRSIPRLAGSPSTSVGSGPSSGSWPRC